MGAYEFQGVSPISCGCPGDLDGDCDTDIHDFARFAPSFNTRLGDSSFNPAADLDGDGAVGIFDFAIFAADWECGR
jgi:hypothetical protein